MKVLNRKMRGFTLLEMMLVMAIMSAMMALLVNYSSQRLSQFQRDRAALQMQQILNAGIAYYVSNGVWPITGTGTPALGSCPSKTTVTPGEAVTSAQTLEVGNYLPSAILSFNSPWQNSYYVNCSTTAGTNYFQVSVDTTSVTNADILEGELPIAYIPTATNTPGGTWVTAQVTIPGQNLNNARSVNFANVYHHGACVPQPVCPSGMSAEIVVAPSSVSGINDNGSQLGYPITSFTAYTSGPAATTPLDCDTMSTGASCYSTGTTLATTANNQLYWRVCLAIYTTQGKISSSSSTTWGQYVSVMAFTRCSPTNENAGSDWTVWTD